ncbi:MAG: hypothetical protein ISR86_06630 [Nitrospinaceae bacterium]|nr:hypothetical protein [Candidatus Brocadiales bacterium]MBL7020203.1 hypothetical protein [Nitrospinaceae bacterium]
MAPIIKRSIFTTIIGFLFIVSTSSLALAASTTNKGSTPNGKPFTNLQGQIDQNSEDISYLQLTTTELQAQLDTLSTQISEEL